MRSFVQGDAPFIGFDNYRKVFARPDVRAGAARTPWSSRVVSLVFQFAIGLALAVFFNQHFRLSATLRALFLVPWLLPLIVSASTWSWMLNSDSGVVNARAARRSASAPVNWLTSPRLVADRR